MTPREDVLSSCSALARTLQRTVGIRIIGSETGTSANRETSVHTSVIPRPAICRASTRGSLPSGDPSSNPDIQTEDNVYMYARLRGRTAKRALFSFQKNKPEKLDLPSPYSPTPCGGASAMSTIILLACSLQSILSDSARAAVTASGPSPPPEAYKLERSRCTLSISDEKPKLRVT
jgi:hypothetical protein